MSLRYVIVHLVALCAICSPQQAPGIDGRRPDLLQELSPEELRILAIATDGTSLAIATGTLDTPPQVIVFDVATGKEKFSLDGHHGEILDVAYSPDGRALVTASEDCSVRIWDSNYGEELWRVEGLLVPTTGVAILKNGERLITHNRFGTIALWDIRGGNIVGHVQDATWRGPGDTLRLTRDESHVIAYSIRDCGIWQLPSLKEIGTFQLSSELGEIRDVAVSKSERRVAFTNRKGNKVFLRDFEGRDVGSLVAAAEPAFAIAASPDGKVWAVCSGIGRGACIELFDVASGTVKRRWKTIDSHEANQVVGRVLFSPEGKSIVTATGENVRIWTVK